MNASIPDPWRPARPWQIVRSDLPLAHVFMPLSSFTFEREEDPELGIGYRIAHTNQTPHPNCFCDTFLRPVGKHHTRFGTAAGRDTLPMYTKATDPDYVKITRSLEAYLNRNHEVLRLEGVMKVPCHAHGGPAADESVAGHAPLWIKTPVHVYQFENVVEGERPLLLVTAPLNPICPSNNDGSAVGLA